MKSRWNLIEHSDLFMMLCTFTPGVTPGNLNESSTFIRPFYCFGIVQNSNSMCESCQVFRKSPLTMLCNQNAKKQSQSATSANSHCLWKYLSTEEAELLVKKLTGRETKDGKRNKSLETKIPGCVLLSISFFG